MAPGEALPLGVDFAPSLEPGETLGRSHQIGARLRDSTLNRGAAGMLAGPPAAAGTRVQQRVGPLRPGRRYRLDIVVYRRRPVRVLMATLAIDCVAGEAAEVG